MAPLMQYLTAWYIWDEKEGNFCGHPCTTQVDRACGRRPGSQDTYRDSGETSQLNVHRVANLLRGHEIPPPRQSARPLATDGTDVAPNNLADHPSDQTEDWSSQGSLPATLKFQLECHVYDGPGGKGFVGIARVKIGANVWQQEQGA